MRCSRIGGVNGRSSLLFLDAATVRDKLKANPWIARSDRAEALSRPASRSTSSSARPSRCGSRTARLAVISDDGVVLEPYVAPRSCRCRSWSARAPKPAPRISSRCLRSLSACEVARPRPRSSSASGAGICVSRMDSTSGLPETTSVNALAALVEARQGRQVVLARHHRDRHAPAGPPDRAACRKTPRRRAKNCSRKRSRRRRPVTHDRPRSQPDAEDAADAAEAHRAGGVAGYRHQQDRLHDRAAEAVPAERRVARPHPCHRS